MALQDAGAQRGQAVGFADELRVGLFGQVRRVLTPRGIAVRQPRQISYEWVYLALAVDGQAGRLSWTWLASMDASEIELAVDQWQEDGLEALVWDGASSHRAGLILEQDLPLVQLPPASPELNPAERVFEELRRVLEGRTYTRIEEKVLRAENALRRLAADPEAVRRLCGWAWIVESLDALPEQLI